MNENSLSTTTIIVNNVAVPIVPNSFNFTEGFGEYKQRSASVGGGRSKTVFSEDVESKKSKFKFAVYNTPKDVKMVREWKALKNKNLIEASDEDFNRTFSRAALINDYEVNIGAEGQIELEWESDPAS